MTEEEIKKVDEIVYKTIRGLLLRGYTPDEIVEMCAELK